MFSIGAVFALFEQVISFCNSSSVISNFCVSIAFEALFVLEVF